MDGRRGGGRTPGRRMGPRVGGGAAVHLQLRERFHQDLPVLRLHSDKGGEFSSDLLRDFCRGEGILQSFTLPDSPQQNAIAERRIGLVMEVTRTSMIHAAAPHFLWPFAVRHAAHQLNLWPHVSLPETSPTLRWTGKVGDASVFQVWGSRAIVRDTYADKLSARAIPCDVMFNESVPFYRLFPYRSVPLPPPPLFLAPSPPPVDPIPPQGPAPSGVSQVDPPPGAVPGEVVVNSGAARGTASGGAEPGGAEPGGAEPGGTKTGGAELGGAETGGAEPGGPEPEGVETGGAESEGAESEGAEPQGAALSGGSAGASPRLSPQQLREWLVRLRSGASGAGSAGVGGAGVRAGAGVTGGTVATGPGGARTRGTGAAGTGGVGGAGAGDPTESGAAGGAGDGGVGVGGTGVGGAGAGGTGAGGAGAIDPGDAVRPRVYFIPLLQQLLGVPSSTGLLCPPLAQSQLPLQPASPLPTPSPYTEQSGDLTQHREPASLPVSPVRTARRVPRLRPPPDPGTHAMALRPFSVPLRVPLPAPPESSLPEVPDPESDRARATSPAVSHLLATAITGPSFEYAAASALVAELHDFAAVCRLDYATALVAESESASPPSVGGECALGTDVLQDMQEDFECLPRSYAEAITGPYSSQWQTAMDAKMASWKSTGTYVDEVPPPGANMVDGMWIFKVKRPPGSPPAFKARYVARGFSQRQGVDYFQTFSPTLKMTTLRVLLHVAAQRDYKLHSLDFSTAFLQGSLHEEIWLRRPPGFTGSFPAGTQWSLRRLVYGLCQAPREWHDTLRTTLAALGFAPSTADPSLFLRTDTSLPPFYVLVYADDLVFATADTEALTLVKSELQKRHTCTDLDELRNYLGLQITRDRARCTFTLNQSHMEHQVLQRFGFQFSSQQPTPLSTSHSLSAPPSDESVEPSGPYPELVGCLMYPMTCTRPDLAYPLSLLARYAAPGRHRKVHWDAAKRVLRYLCSTSGMGLVLGGWGPVVLTGHANASWVDDSATQRSSQGYTSSLGSASVSWRSTRSSSVLSSICEAEIYAGAMAAQELRWLTYLLTDLGEQPRSPLVLYVDSKAMIALCQEHRAVAIAHYPAHCALLPCLLQRYRAALPRATPPRAALLPCVLRCCPYCPARCALPCSLRAALLAARCPARRALPCSLRAALLPARCLAPQPARCPALQPARCPALQPVRCLATTETTTTATAATTAVASDAPFGSGQQKQCQSETLSLQQLREWVARRGRSGHGAWNFMRAGGTGQQWRSCREETLPPQQLRTGQQWWQRQQETLSPQQLREWVSQRCVPRSAEATSLARASTVLPCPAAPSASPTGFHLPLFSKNLVSNDVAASGQVAASGRLAASCSCRLLSHHGLVWHHRLGHPSLPCLRSMHSRLLVSSLPRSLPPLLRSLAPPCLPCVEGQQRTAPHSSLFPPATAPLQTLHMDMWGPARVHGHDQERYL
ncbi:unnamed protein product [Closterium sp. NIES-54]